MEKVHLKSPNPKQGRSVLFSHRGNSSHPFSYFSFIHSFIYSFIPSLIFFFFFFVHCMPRTARGTEYLEIVSCQKSKLLSWFLSIQKVVTSVKI